MEEKKVEKLKKILFYLIILLSFYILSCLILVTIVYLSGYFEIDLKSQIIIQLIFNIFYFLFISYIYRKTIINDFKSFFKKDFFNSLLLYLVGVLLMYLINYILNKTIGTGVSQNESNIRELVKEVPLYIAFSSIIYAPFIEEIIFRKTISKIISNKWLYIIISGLLFGITHIKAFSINELLLNIPYIIMGMTFAYIFNKYKNIFNTIVLHSLHNLTVLILLLLFGGIF